MTISIKNVAIAVSFIALLYVVAAALPADSHAINPPKCIFNTIVQPQNNGGTTLSWRVFDATNVHLSGVGDVDDADALVVFPNTITTYTITATGRGGVTTCEAVAHPVSSYPNLVNGIFNFGNVPTNNSQFCGMNVSPDLVVPGGTAVLSWTAPGATNAWLDHGIGNVSATDSRVIPAPVTPVTYTLTAENSNGTTRTCSATVQPATGVAGVQTPGAFVPQAPGITLPGIPTTTAQGVPTVTVTPTFQAAPVTSVSLSSVPYTGPEDTLYVLALTLVALGAGVTLFRNRHVVFG